MNKPSAIKVIRPAVSTNGKITAVSMVIELARSGCPLKGIALYRQMNDADRALVAAGLA